jgi:hypothetical protein
MKFIYFSNMKPIKLWHDGRLWLNMDFKALPKAKPVKQEGKLYPDSRSSPWPPTHELHFR